MGVPSGETWSSQAARKARQGALVASGEVGSVGVPLPSGRRESEDGSELSVNCQEAAQQVGRDEEEEVRGARHCAALGPAGGIPEEDLDEEGEEASVLPPSSWVTSGDDVLKRGVLLGVERLVKGFSGLGVGGSHQQQAGPGLGQLALRTAAEQVGEVRSAAGAPAATQRLFSDVDRSQRPGTTDGSFQGFTALVPASSAAAGPAVSAAARRAARARALSDRLAAASASLAPTQSNRSAAGAYGMPRAHRETEDLLHHGRYNRGTPDAYGGTGMASNGDAGLGGRHWHRQGGAHQSFAEARLDWDPGFTRREDPSWQPAKRPFRQNPEDGSIMSSAPRRLVGIEEAAQELTGNDVDHVDGKGEAEMDEGFRQEGDGWERHHGSFAGRREENGGHGLALATAGAGRTSWGAGRGLRGSELLRGTAEPESFGAGLSASYRQTFHGQSPSGSEQAARAMTQQRRQHQQQREQALVVPISAFTGGLPPGSVPGVDRDVAIVRKRLLRLAAAVDRRDLREIQDLMQVLMPFSNKRGAAVNRAVHYSLNALVLRMSGMGPAFLKMEQTWELRALNLAKMWYVKNYPAVPFTGVAMCGMLWNKLLGRSSVHIVDMGWMMIPQWPYLIKMLAQQPGQPLRHLRFTWLDTTDILNPGRREFNGVEAGVQVSQGLTAAAQAAGIGFSFEHIKLDKNNLHVLYDVRRRPQDALVFSASFDLAFWPTENNSMLLGMRGAFLKWMRMMEPDAVAMMEVDVEANSKALAPRFKAFFEFCLASFAAQEACASWSDLHHVHLFEEVFFSRMLTRIVACEGEDRVFQPVSAASWAQLFTMAGFVKERLSSTMLDAAYEVVKCFPSDFGLSLTDEVLCLTWQGSPLAFACCWTVKKGYNGL